MFIQTEMTANPARIRFLPGQTLLSAGTAGFLDKESSARSPLAQRLFEVEGIASVYLDPQAITLTKTDDVEWPMLKPVIFAAIMEHFAAGEPAILDESQPLPRPGLDTQEGQVIQSLLEQRINPQVASHGGHISLVDVQDDTAYIRLEGGCQGCGMADVTLKQGVAKEIQALVPTISKVLDVTDHAGGTNPYYQSGKGDDTAASPFYQPGK
jgi:Fe-S cluster biogenesis protein NfuA